MFELQLGPVKLRRELGVADIKDDVLLGDNILRRDPEGPMNIMNSQNIVTFRGQEIPLEPVGLPMRALRLTTIDDEVIPGMSEKIIDAFVHRPEGYYSEQAEEDLLVEGDPSFQEKYGCLVTPVVVRTVGKVTTQMRIFNPFAEPVLLGGEEALGSLTPVKIEHVLQMKSIHRRKAMNSVVGEW